MSKHLNEALQTVKCLYCAKTFNILSMNDRPSKFCSKACRNRYAIKKQS